MITSDEMERGFDILDRVYLGVFSDLVSTAPHDLLSSARSLYLALAADAFQLAFGDRAKAVWDACHSYKPDFSPSGIITV